MGEVIGSLIGLAIVVAAIVAGYMFFTSQAVLVTSGPLSPGSSYQVCTYFTGAQSIDVGLEVQACPRWAKITKDGLRFP